MTCQNKTKRIEKKIRLTKKYLCICIMNVNIKINYNIIIKTNAKKKNKRTF